MREKKEGGGGDRYDSVILNSSTLSTFCLHSVSTGAQGPPSNGLTLSITTALFFMAYCVLIKHQHENSMVSCGQQQNKDAAAWRDKAVFCLHPSKVTFGRWCIMCADPDRAPLSQTVNVSTSMMLWCTQHIMVYHNSARGSMFFLFCKSE